MSNPAILVAVGGMTVAAGHVMGLDVPLSLGLGVGSVAVGLGVQTFLKLDPTTVKKERKKKKVSSSFPYIPTLALILPPSIALFVPRPTMSIFFCCTLD